MLPPTPFSSLPSISFFFSSSSSFLPHVYAPPLKHSRRRQQILAEPGHRGWSRQTVSKYNVSQNSITKLFLLLRLHFPTFSFILPPSWPDRGRHSCGRALCWHACLSEPRIPHCSSDGCWPSWWKRRKDLLLWLSRKTVMDSVPGVTLYCDDGPVAWAEYTIYIQQSLWEPKLYVSIIQACM